MTDALLTDVAGRAHGAVRGVGEVLAAGLLRVVFQPIVDLDDRRVLGYEALTRGPVGDPLERPDLLFAAARREGLLAELDATCRAAAIAGARAGGLRRPYRLFVNAEPETLGGWAPERSGPEQAGVVLELTERALVADPAELLRTVARVRELGWGIALDDVGADPASLALLPLVAPDVIKLDLHLVQQHGAAEVAVVVGAVHAEAERSGALVLAEGIETERHLDIARSFGAVLGQGWLFGRPGPLPEPSAHPVQLPAQRIEVRPSGATSMHDSPFAHAALRRPVRTSDKAMLIAMSKQLEAQALASGASAIVLSTFQDARYLTPDTVRRYRVLAARCSFVAALGVGIGPHPLPGVRGATLAPDDPVVGEWDIAVLGPHFAAALVAQDLGDTTADERSRRFRFVLTHDRELVSGIAARLMSRVHGAA